MGNNGVNLKQKQERLGEINYNTYGTKMKIIEYTNASDIWIEFQDEYKYKKHTRYGDFKKGEINNPYDKTVYKIGYMGYGKYSSKIHKKAYREWLSMFTRCYDDKYQEKYLTYKECVVCKEWYNFQNFAEWYYNNYYEIKGQKMRLDKDILNKGNKIYSPNTCVFVPERINNLFVKRDNDRGELPIGCTYNDKDKKWIKVQCNMINKQEHIGFFSYKEPFKAFTCYKNFKENYIKQVADEYKNLIPIDLYNAMYRWEVEIND